MGRLNYNHIRKKEFLHTTEKDVFEDQFNIIDTGLQIIEQQIIDIENIGQNTNYKNPVESLGQSKLLVTKNKYLSFFKDISKFLLNKLKSEDLKYSKFYLTNVRTLLDIYSKLLYLANQDEDTQILICIFEDLIHAKMVMFSKKMFEDIYSEYKLFLDYKNITIPDFEKFSINKISNFRFLTLDKILTKKYMENFIPSETFSKKIDIPNKTYKIYRALSGYVHGNVLNKDTFGNEDLWVIRNIIYLQTLIIALIDKNILYDKNNDKIEIFIKKILNRQDRFNIFYDRNRQMPPTNK